MSVSSTDLHITVRKATHNDLGALAQVNARFNDVETTAAQIAERLADPKCVEIPIVAEVDNQMAKRDWYCEDVLSGKLEIKTVWEDERVLAFHHPQPQAEIHVVVIPKQHVPSLLDPMALDGELLTSMVQAIQAVARQLGLDNTGFYVRANAAAPGVTPHMHWHIIGPGIP